MPAPITNLTLALKESWARKSAQHARNGATRLLNSGASGTPRLVFELYGKHGILFDYGHDNPSPSAPLTVLPKEGDPSRKNAVRRMAGEWLQTFGWESLSMLDRASAGDEGRSGNHALAGAPPEELVIEEEGLKVRLEPRHPRNVGLFLDTRVLRRELRDTAQDATVLNLFCYTGSLGLAALFGREGTGAAQVTQVDISARYLNWARANTRLNGLPEDRCKFVKMDSERYLDWAHKKGLRFDRIILDPPVFSRFDGKVFRWADDYFRLAAKCAALLSPGGTLYAVTNYAGIGPAEFAASLAATFRDAGLNAAPPRRIGLPEDYDLPADAADLPEGNAILMALRRD